jgi:hypothetical protein
MKITSSAILTVLVFGCIAFLPNGQAVIPAPDGGYPSGNTAEGQTALLSLTTGGFNTAVGFLSLRSNTTNSFNTAIGAGTLLANTADENTATGAGALLSNTTGFRNTADGAFALFSNTTGVANTATGREALFTNTGGNSNTAVGPGALISSTGSSNTALGVNAGIAVTTANSVICIGSVGRNVNNGCFIGNIRSRQTQIADAIPVLIDSNEQLGTVSSSRRFKREIKPMDKASEAILALKPVAFHYKSDKTNTPQFGLIAEEVAEVNPDLVVRDKNGEIYTVRYDAVNAMLLNEFLKEHRKVEEQSCKIENQARKIQEEQTTITHLQKEMEIVIAHSKEQDSQIQRVSAQLQISNPVKRVAAENP